MEGVCGRGVDGSRHWMPQCDRSRLMTKKKVKAVKLTVGLPFNLGSLELEPDEVERQVAWELYVELVTRVAVEPLGPTEGLMRESLDSLYEFFVITRSILKEAGPSVARSPESVGAIAIAVLNQGMRPILAKWHPLLCDYEEQRAEGCSAVQHEQNWERVTDLRRELDELRIEMIVYLDVLAKIAGVEIGRKEWAMTSSM